MKTQHERSATHFIDVEPVKGPQKKRPILEGIALGEQAVRDGQTVSNEAAKARFAKWLS